MISQSIKLFENGLEYKNADRRKKQDKDVEAKEGTVNDSVFIHLTT